MASTPPPRFEPPRGRWRRASLLVALALSGAFLLAACGSSGSAPSTTSSSSPPGSAPSGSGKGGVTIAYSQCMRSHGVPNFPDPNSQGVIEGKSSSGSGGSGLNPNSPTYQAAQNTCQKYASGGNTPADQAQQLKQALKFTACMRAHGVPNFPDPTVVNGQIEFDGTSGVGRTPDFPSAQSACQSLLAEGSGS